MAFDFLCPNGHVLQADESAAGQPCNCPHCGAAFLIPQPAGAQPMQNQVPYQQPVEQQYQPEPEQPPMDPGLAQVGQVQLDHMQYGDQVAPAEETYEGEYYEEGEQEYYDQGEYEETYEEQSGVVDPTSGLKAMSGASGQVIHIPCPNGHWLEATRDMTGGYATCPYCNETFLVSYEQSREGQRERKLKEKAREDKIASNWLTWTIIIAVGVVVLIFSMIATQ